MLVRLVIELSCLIVQRLKFPANLEGIVSGTCASQAVIVKNMAAGLMFSAVFCDPAGLSPSLSTWQEQVSNDIVYAAFGMHPHNAKYYNLSMEQK